MYQIKLKLCWVLLLGSVCSHVAAQGLVATQRKIWNLPSVVPESSGMVMSTNHQIWTHSDSGDPNLLWKVDTLGNVVRTLRIQNAINTDWEDLARDQQGNIWINDAGNNGQGRRDLKMYRIQNPDLHSLDTVQAIVLNFSFEDQTAFPPPVTQHNFDIEAISWFADSLYLFTKDRSTPFTGYTKMYVLPADSGNYIARLVDSFFVDADAQRGRITAADIDTSTGTLALLTRAQILCFYNYPGTRFFSGSVHRYFFQGRVDQVEALAFVNRNTLYMTDEGSPANNVNGSLYEVKLSQSVDIEELPWQSKLRLHVPASRGGIHIFLPENQPAFISIKNMQGGEVLQTLTEDPTYLTLPMLPAGIYYLQVKQNGRFYAAKFSY